MNEEMERKNYKQRVNKATNLNTSKRKQGSIPKIQKLSRY